jgi:NAD(P)-dependent dehydrogenase (short-subunit alcohol dehydrogenase family)
VDLSNTPTLPRQGDMKRRRAIFITGAGSGIGQAIAAHFSRKGWSVGLSDVSLQGLAETAQLIACPYASSHPLDVRERDNWKAGLAAFASRFDGRIDVVVNNAGIGVGGPLINLNDAAVDQMIDVNFRGVVSGARAAHRYLKAAGPGSCLLNVASASALYGAPGLALYSSTKFAVRGLTEALDLEWEAGGIRCRSLMPAFVDTPMMAQPAEPGCPELKRDRVLAAKLEFTSSQEVAAAAWRAVHGSKTHVLVGASAKQLHLAARWAPSLLRRRLRGLMPVPVVP